MEEIFDIQRPFGMFAPAKGLHGAAWLTRLGLARGKIAKFVYHHWLRHHGPWVDAEIRGIKYRLNIRDNTTDSKILVSSKTYDAKELAFLAKATRDRVFVDIGANTGYYTLNMLKAGCRRAIAIEPNPPALERLRFNIGVNSMADRVDVAPVGVGPDGELDFYQTGGLGGSGFIAPEQPAPVIKVKTTPLLRILSDHGVPNIGGLKIDVEGFEDQALGPFLSDAPDHLLPRCIVMETCHEGEWGSNLGEALRARGYRIAARTRSNDIHLRDRAG